jgi:hypothetical protein
MEIRMKLMVLAVAALAVIATNANAKSVKKPAAAALADRYYDSAHGPNEPHSLWLAGD